MANRWEPTECHQRTVQYFSIYNVGRRNERYVLNRWSCTDQRGTKSKSMSSIMNEHNKNDLDKLTFPTASKPLSKRKIIPRKMKPPPKIVRPRPISEKSDTSFQIHRLTRSKTHFENLTIVSACSICLSIALVIDELDCKMDTTVESPYWACTMTKDKKHFYKNNQIKRLSHTSMLRIDS